jgi:hypothetical protein
VRQRWVWRQSLPTRRGECWPSKKITGRQFEMAQDAASLLSEVAENAAARCGLKKSKIQVGGSDRRPPREAELIAEISHNVTFLSANGFSISQFTDPPPASSCGPATTQFVAQIYLKVKY